MEYDCSLLKQIDGGESHDPSDTVDGDGVERVVDLEADEKALGREEGEAGDRADDQRAPHGEDVAPGAHGHGPCRKSRDSIFRYLAERRIRVGFRPSVQKYPLVHPPLISYEIR